MQKTFCDRCDREIQDKMYVITEPLEVDISSYRNPIYDAAARASTEAICRNYPELCEHCFISFNDWMHGNRYID